MYNKNKLLSLLWVIVATLACTVLGRRLDSVILILSRPRCWVKVEPEAQSLSVSNTNSESDAFPLVDSALALGSPEFLTDSLDKEKNAPSVVCLLAISQLASFSCAHGAGFNFSLCQWSPHNKKRWRFKVVILLDYTFQGQKNNIEVAGSRFCRSQTQLCTGSARFRLFSSQVDSYI